MLVVFVCAHLRTPICSFVAVCAYVFVCSAAAKSVISVRMDTYGSRIHIPEESGRRCTGTLHTRFSV